MEGVAGQCSEDINRGCVQSATPHLRLPSWVQTQVPLPTHLASDLDSREPIPTCPVCLEWAAPGWPDPRPLASWRKHTGKSPVSRAVVRPQHCPTEAQQGGWPAVCWAHQGKTTLLMPPPCPGTRMRQELSVFWAGLAPPTGSRRVPWGQLGPFSHRKPRHRQPPPFWAVALVWCGGQGQTGHTYMARTGVWNRHQLEAAGDQGGRGELGTGSACFCL